MGKRWTWVAWAMLVAWAAGVAAFCVLSLANGNLQTEPLTDTVPLLLAFAAFMVVGALLVAHRPSNTIGWVFSAIGLLAVAGALAEEYAHYAYLTRPGSLPGAIVATWLAWCSWYPTVALAVVYTPLLFPTGRLLSPRWRPVAWLAGTATAAVVVVAALQPAFELPGGRTVPNPIGVEGVGNPDEGPIGTTLTNLLIVSTVAAFVSLVLRFRRSRGEERQQLKWFTYAAALVPFVALTDVLPDTVGNLLFAALVAMLPVAAGIAVLRYRLYEIDRLINRTLVYGLLTVLLGAVYVVGVFGFGRLLNPVTGESALAVAAATLAVAALFQPARRRVQAVVDRRFNRRRYDAARTVEAFSLRLRDQVELDTLSAELLTVVDQTMQPTALSLWLSPSAQSMRREKAKRSNHM